jgi:8-amino-7-oxononanoate synthase
MDAEAAPWAQRVRREYAEFERVVSSSPLINVTVSEIDGRRVRIGDRWFDDFASCNYLGFDLDPEIVEGVLPYLRSWGTHPSWSMMLARPVLCERIEDRLRELLGAEDVLLLPTLTHIHNAALPVLAAGGVVLVDHRAHRTIHDGALAAKARGATVRRFRHGDLDQLERLLRKLPAEPRVICMDGVNSMTGNPPDLPAFAELARRHGALLYVDDAHGFGIIGERRPDERCPYGVRGNAIVRHFGESYEHIVLTAGMSKAYSSLLAFTACPAPTRRLLEITASSYTYSGPPPVAALASALLGLEINERRGDVLRSRIHQLTSTLLEAIADLAAKTPNSSGLPIVELILADPDDVVAVGRHLYDRGILVTMAPPTVVPHDEIGFRIQLTAANTDDQLDRLIEVLKEISKRFGFRPECA